MNKLNTMVAVFCATSVALSLVSAAFAQATVEVGANNQLLRYTNPNTVQPAKTTEDNKGNVEVNGRLTIAGDPNETPPADGDLTVSGLTTAQGGLTVTGNTMAQGDLTATGLTTAQGGLTVTGATTAQGDLTVSGLTTAQGGLTVTGTTTAQGDLNVTGANTTVQGLTVTGATTARGPLTVTGLATAQGGLTVTGLTTAQGGLTVTGLTKAQGDLNVTGTTTAQGGLTVMGLATLTQLEVASSREWKYDISRLAGSAALTLLEELDPVAFKFKDDNSTGTHFGFIAEEIPAVLTDSGGQRYRPIEIIAVLTKALQEQQTMIQRLQEQVRTLRVATRHN